MKESNIFTSLKTRNNFFSLGDKVVMLMAIGGLATVAISALALIIKWPTLPPEVPLFYSKPWGSAQLAQKSTLWLIPGIAAVIWIVDFVIIRISLKNDKFLSRILAIFGSLSTILLSISLIKIIFQVGG